MSLQALYPSVGATLTTTGNETLSSSADFEVLGLALAAADLVDTVGALSDATLFAPTDAAFAGLAADFGYAGDPADATGVFNAIAGALAGLDPGGDPIPLLTQILQYHVAPEAETQAALNAEGPVSTLLADTTLEVSGGTVVDNDPDSVNGDIIVPDVATDGVTIQVVDQVLLPFDTPADIEGGTLLDRLKESGGSFDDAPGDFDLLVLALQATGLDAAADDPDADLTVFAPTDGAFFSLAQDLGYQGNDEAGAFQAIVDASAAADPENPLQLVTDILTYHISAGAQDAAAVLAAEELATLNGATLGVEGTNLIDQDPDAATASIVQTDIAAENGIAHVIDEVLLPVDLPEADSSQVTPLPDVEDDTPADDGSDFPFEILGAVALLLALFGGGIAV